MLRRIKPLWINWGLTLLAFGSLTYSMNQYGNDGCDGGLCALYLFLHGIPLIFSWLFFAISLNQLLKRRKLFFLFWLITSGFLSLILMQDFGYRLDELYFPAYLLAGLLLLILVLKFLLKPIIPMEITHLQKNHFRTLAWSGGETTEFFIFPYSTCYADRDFDFRLSTASVEVEQSDFTALEGVSRTLMVLSGEMKLIHQNHHEVSLSPFDVDRFQGGWNTRSEGCCSDFNLMTRGATQGDLKSIRIEAGDLTSLTINKLSWIFFYAFNGNGKIKAGANSYQLVEGELLAVQHPIEQEFLIETETGINFVIVEIA